MDTRNQVWTTKDGQKVKVRDMTDSHLTNTLKFLARRAQCRCSKHVTDLVNCPPPQGEYAQVAYESELDDIFSATFDDFVPDIYWAMVDEYANRGLDMEALHKYNEGVVLAGASLEVDQICEHFDSNEK